MSEWIADWRPEDATFWRERGRAIARRNLVWSVLAEFLGFSVWQLWSAVSVNLDKAGFDLTTSQLFWLVSVPGLAGATMRFPYTFAVPRFGGRDWTVFSALALLAPTIGLTVCVSDPSTPYGVMLATAALAGLGGGNFASSMANISFFYPDDRKGAALGLNAAGGNVGVAVVQKLVPWVTAGAISGGGLHLADAGIVWVPLIMVAAWGAWRYMDNLADCRSSFGDQRVVVRRSQTWMLTWLYIGTFGSFIGSSAALPLLIKTEFIGHDPLAYAFLGPLVGSLARPLGGWLSDRVGGERVTLWAFAGISGTVLLILEALSAGSFGLFLSSFLALFVLSGVGNGSTFRMMPSVLRDEALARAGERGETREDALRRARREAAATMGFVSAAAAYGSFVIPQGYNLSQHRTGGLQAALLCFLGFYVSCLALTWWAYVRRQRGRHTLVAGAAEAGASEAGA